MLFETRKRISSLMPRKTGARDFVEIDDRDVTLEPQRVLLCHRFFSPDATTYARMLEDYANYLGSLGHDVTVCTSQPSYHGIKSEKRLGWVERREVFRIVRAPVPAAG